MEDDEGEKERREGGGFAWRSRRRRRCRRETSHQFKPRSDSANVILDFFLFPLRRPRRRNRLHLSSGTSSIRVITLITIAIVGS